MVGSVIFIEFETNFSRVVVRGRRRFKATKLAWQEEVEAGKVGEEERGLEMSGEEEKVILALIKRHYMSPSLIELGLRIELELMVESATEA